MRREGSSIPEIVEALGVPKTTVWAYIRGLVIAPEVKKILNGKRGGNVRRMKIRVERARGDIEKIVVSGKRELAIMGAMLYWAEGNKESFVFTNSDHRIIAIFLKCMREVYGITDERFSITLRIFSGMDESSCLAHWEEVTQIEKSKMKVRWNDGGTRTSSVFGILRITLKKGGYTLHQFKQLADLITSEYTTRKLL